MDSFVNPLGGFSFRTLGSPVSEHAQCFPCRSDKCCHSAVAPGFVCDPRRGQGSAAPGTPGSVGIPRTQRSGSTRRGALPWDRDPDLSWETRHEPSLHGGMVKKVSGHLAPGPTIGPEPSLYPFVNLFIHQNVFSACLELFGG